MQTNIRLDYLMRPTPQKLLRQYWAYGRGRARTVFKHQMKPRLRQLIPVLNFGLMVMCIALSGLWPTLLFWPTLYLSVLAGLSLLATLKMRSLCGLWAGVVLGIIHNAWAAGFLWQASHSKVKAPQSEQPSTDRFEPHNGP